MPHTMYQRFLTLLLVIGVFVLAANSISGQSSNRSSAVQAQDGDWTYYGGNIRNWKYRPFDQINASNFSKLQVAWRFRTDNMGPQAEFRLGATPLMVNGVVYVVGGGMRRSVAALEAGSGAMLWIHSEDEGLRAQFAPRVSSGRGVAYWTDGKEERILYVTTGYRLKALNARTGALIPGFGKAGVVDLKQDFDQDLSRFAGPSGDGLVMADIGLHATPIVAGNIIIVGAAGREGTTPVRTDEPKGYVRAFDVRTGKRLWTFHTIPKAGEFGYDTWLNGSAERNGHTGVWTQMAVDEDLGLAYLPVETPTNDYYGGHRPGNNLFAESLVCVDLKTGQRKWHFQIVHHPLWDHDLSSAPILTDINVDGRAIKAVAMPSKQGFLYVFDRVTGQPVWPIEERPVPKGDAPGEWYSPTQPFPTRPPAYSRQALTTDELIDFTPELRAEAVKIASRFHLAKLYDPLVISKPEGPIKSLSFVTALGGTNWPGGSYDPETHTVYVSSNHQVVGLALLPVTDKRFSDSAYVGGDVLAGLRDVQGHSGDGPRLHGGRSPEKPAAPGNPNPPSGMGAGFLGAPTVQGLPINKPPYGTISAINLDRGDIVWQIPHGETPDVVRNHPLLKGRTIPRTGQQTSVGTLVTKTLVIAGEPGITTLPDRPRGAMLRAYDKATGQEVGAVYMPAPQTGSPMTYMWNGRQYIIVAVSGGNVSGEYIAFSVPGTAQRPTTSGAQP
jgi:quinoprotein glucose dehydrogenase